MARRNISLPDELDELARVEGLNVSALARKAIVEEVERRHRMSTLDLWLDELDQRHGPLPAEVVAEADTWAEQAVRPSP